MNEKIMEIKVQLAIAVLNRVNTLAHSEKIVDDTVRITNGIFRGLQDDKDYEPHHKD